MNIIKGFWLAWRYAKRIPNKETSEAIESIDRGSFVEYTSNDAETIFFKELKNDTP